MKNTTKKILAIAIVLLFFCRTNTFAQGDAYQQGSSIISIGYGFPNIYKDVFSVEDIFPGYTSSGFGPLHLKYEYAINEHWGIGVGISYFSFKNSWSEPSGLTDSLGNSLNITGGWKGDALSFLARVNYHFATSDKFDPYVGIGLGYTDWSFTYTDNTAAVYQAAGFGSTGFSTVTSTLSFPGFAFEGSIGCRYYVAPSFAIWAEVGYGVDIAQIGLNVKFGGSK